MILSAHSVEYFVIRLLLAAGESSTDNLHRNCSKYVGHMQLPQFVKYRLSPMIEAGWVEHTETWKATAEGEALFRQVEAKAHIATQQWRPAPGVYAGNELKSLSNRPGAYDFMRYPSRMGNNRKLPNQ